VAVGLEQNRLAILLAVLHRHGGLQMADQDQLFDSYLWPEDLS
jgi:DNA repair protein RadA/Sms